MPFDLKAAEELALAAERLCSIAAHTYIEGLQDLAAAAATEADAEHQSLVDGAQRLAENAASLEVRLREERRYLAVERARLDAERSHLEEERRLFRQAAAVGAVGARIAGKADLSPRSPQRSACREVWEPIGGAQFRLGHEHAEERGRPQGERHLPRQLEVSDNRREGSRRTRKEEGEIRSEQLDQDEVVVLNVANKEHPSVPRAVLQQVPKNSRFAEVVSERHVRARDSSGHILVDHDPEIFMPLLEHLRMRHCEDPDDPVKPPVFPPKPQNLEMRFRTMLVSYGLYNWVYRSTFTEPAELSVESD
eukprot:gnl/TRDRNA2_/TRDRNA2_29114_c0_seq1.p1 gnl/TRDRNA2_/TRDRNA2_29114_c0~~gnl/TRDRNA2_/TRDRNA2_29114_c0_seq1.p1  ORF type:complete len:307 (-),score=61.13 gnl/TRDRNA2_/TRDRNA2_29114_c0_seq1:45-965(-)